MEWTANLVDTLVELHNLGVPTSIIAETLDTSRNSVIGKLNRLGYAKPKASAQPDKPKAQRKAPFRPPSVSPVPYYEPAPVVTPVVKVPDVVAVSFMDLKAGHCKWPVDTPGPVQMYCGRIAQDGKPYCAEHHARSVQKPQPRDRPYVPKRAYR